MSQREPPVPLSIWILLRYLNRNLHNIWPQLHMQSTWKTECWAKGRQTSLGSFPVRREPAQHPPEVQGTLLRVGKSNVLALSRRAGRWEGSFGAATDLLLPAVLGSCQLLYNFYEGSVLPSRIRHVCNQQAGSGRQDLLCLPKPVCSSVVVFTADTTVSPETQLEAASLARLRAGDINLDSTWLINRIKIYSLFPSVTMMKQVTVKTYCLVLTTEEIKKLN